ncbi:Transposase DDE domain-containing protein [Quadrisphaera granulorum]|uniref:DDE family transposase n=1 Tax=Quadrisphaera granulorum TaxID=317664 RepID=A0A315ZRE7_9ACTN|nr:DDE family transposase [Quadrisphaera granulorum]SZE98495.1 Transposase DDE domain-containing protein [Quadrisphaera granulorum]
MPATQRGTQVVVVQFAASTCDPCPVRALCTTSKSTTIGRQLTLPPQEVYEVQQAGRAAQASRHWQHRYATRAGVEGTIKQAVAVTGIRRARYRGLDKTRLQHQFAATAINLVRLDAYWNARPAERARTTHLARLELTLAA